MNAGNETKQPPQPLEAISPTRKQLKQAKQIMPISADGEHTPPPPKANRRLVMELVSCMFGGSLKQGNAGKVAASLVTDDCTIDARASMGAPAFCHMYHGPDGLQAWVKSMETLEFHDLTTEFTLGTNGQVFAEISYLPSSRGNAPAFLRMSDVMKCRIEKGKISFIKYSWDNADGLYELNHGVDQSVAYGAPSIGGEQTWPLMIISSYTKFSNLAHGPTGQEAAYSMWTYRMNPLTGQMTLLAVNQNDKTTMNPAFSRIHPTKNVIYACTESVEQNGDVVSWKVDKETGALEKIGSADAHGTSTCYITIDQQLKYALIVNYWNATIVSLQIDQDSGKIGKKVSVYDPNNGRKMSVSCNSHVNHSINNEDAQRERQLDPHSHSVILDPFTGRIAFVPDLGMDLVRQLLFDPETGEISSAGQIESGVKGKIPHGPRYIEFHPSLPIAYVINELSSEIAVFRFNISAAKRMIKTGEVEPTLKLVQMISTLPAAFPKSLNTCGRITVHASGRYVLVSNRGHDSITICRVEQCGPTAGFLSVAQIEHTRGSTPRHFQFDNSGQWLVAANQDSNQISVFSFNLATGDLDYTGNSYSVPSPNFVCCMSTNRPEA